MKISCCSGFLWLRVILRVIATKSANDQLIIDIKGMDGHQIKAYKLDILFQELVILCQFFNLIYTYFIMKHNFFPSEIF